MLIAGLHLPASVWWFYALGPQLVLCLGFGFQAWRRRGGDLLTWLTWSFLAALVPVAGVVVMAWLWWRSPRLPADAPRVSVQGIVREQLGRRYVPPAAPGAAGAGHAGERDGAGAATPQQAGAPPDDGAAP